MEQVKFKKIQESDCDLLFIWVNEPEVRQNAFNPKKVKYEEHIKWFSKILNSNTSKIYIATVNNISIGQIRIDVEIEDGIISYSIDKNYRNRGYGTQLLNRVKDLVLNEDLQIKRLIGKVKKSNLISQRAFEKAKYGKKELNDYIEYFKNIIDE
jgi:RimJ/RimL family protein N-acetyltransferase